MTDGAISANIAAIRAAIARAAAASGRSAADVTLLAATKTQPVDRIREAIAAGVDAAGENRVQEMLEKEGAYDGVPLHFIGRLQKNKVKFVVGRAALIHSVDSLELAELISRRAEAQAIVQDILLEVNIGEESAKGGFLPDKLAYFAEKIAGLGHIRLRGLMCIPPVTARPEESIVYFSKMRQLFVDITPKIVDNDTMRILSMGMSVDYAAAVACGSTLVRVGSGIFGSRAVRA